MVVGIDVEQQVLVALGRGPSRRMRLEIGVPEEPLEQRLRLLHPAPIVGLLGPDGPQVADELLENRQSRARHGMAPIGALERISVLLEAGCALTFFAWSHF